MNTTDKNTLSCGIVHDLLPLYHDGVLNEESRSAVAAHLTDCAACTKKLEQMQTAIPVTQQPESKSGFLKMMKKNRTKRRLVNLVCFLAGGAVILSGTFWFLRKAPVMKWNPDEAQIIALHHYRITDCQYASDANHNPDDDHAVFLYMNLIPGSDIRIEHKNGDLSLTLLHPVMSPVAYELGASFDSLTVPVTESDKTLSINGMKICDLGEPETGAQIPGYITAMHNIINSRTEGAGWEFTEDTEHRTMTVKVYPQPDKNEYTVWDGDGNLLEATEGSAP